MPNDYIAAKPLASVASVSLDGAGPSPSATRLDDLGVDGVVIDGLLTADECSRIVQAAEASGGFGFWDASGDADKRRVRNADTLEFDDPKLCEALYLRLAPWLTPRVAFSSEEEELFEAELEGEWVACGLNTHLLLNRYGAGGHFAPHADGSTPRCRARIRAHGSVHKYGSLRHASVDMRRLDSAALQ